MEFNTQNTLQDAIIAHKYLIHMYCQYGIETSNETLRNLFAENQKIASEHDLKLFKIMNDKGFYPKTAAPAKEVKQTLKMHTEMQEELSKNLAKSSK